MSEYTIAFLPGDGIGPEVTAAGREVLLASCQAEGVPLKLREFAVGLPALEQYGSTLPDEVLEALPHYEGWILGPLTTHLYDIFNPATPNPSGVLRTRFNLFANVRPTRNRQGVPSPFSNIDLTVVRENTEGFYADRNTKGGHGELKVTEDHVVSLRVVTREACERVAEYGFQLAMRRRKRVTLIHKANVLRYGCGLFLEVCREVAKRYPEVEVDDYHIDAMAMHLVLRPRDFDVIITTNMYGDILSDEAAGLVGGLGLAPGLNAGYDHAMAQAVHGSAPDIAGKGIANPCATIESIAMLLDWLEQRHRDASLGRVAERIRRGVDSVLVRPDALTPDLGGTASTEEMTRAMVEKLSKG